MSTEVKREGISTLNDLMEQLQQEIQDVKSGTITEQTARVVLGGRKAQLKAAELGLQYLRIMKPKTPTMDGAEGVPLLPIPQKDSTSSTAAA
jgi:hypothetical protein